MDEEFDLYDRITDRILYLSSAITLDFIVNLAYKSKDGSRRFFHSEYEKTSQYVGTNKSRTITRNIKFYFALNDRESFGNGMLLRPQDVIILTTIIKDQVLPWFTGSTRVFDIKDNRLVIKGKQKPAMYIQSEYRYLSFSPIVTEYQSGQFKEGVFVCLNTQDTNFTMSIDELYGFYYILTNTSMYNLAAELINYVKTPPYGVNLSQLQGLGSGANMNGGQDYNISNRSGADFLNNI